MPIVKLQEHPLTSLLDVGGRPINGGSDMFDGHVCLDIWLVFKISESEKSNDLEFGLFSIFHVILYGIIYRYL